MQTQQQKPAGNRLQTISKIIIVVLILFFLAYFLTPAVFQECNTKSQQYIYWLFHNNLTYTLIFILFCFACLFWFIKSFKSSKNKTGKFIKTLSAFVVLVFALGIYWLTVFPYSGIGGGEAHIANSVNRRRNYDVNDIRTALMQYYEKNKSYPSNLFLLIPNYIKKIPTDPVTNTNYEYSLSANAQDYIVKADLNKFAPGCYSQVTLAPLSRRLQKLDLEYDLDGKVYGLDCEDPAYCKGPEEFQ